MDRHARVYRALVALYPREFRRTYADDLVQSFVDLAKRDGPVRAWTRTLAELSWTIPRYRLETTMSATNTTFTMQLAVAGLAAAGVVSILTGLLPGALLLIAALFVGVTQRTRLARAVRVPDATRRRRLLTAATLLAITCVVGTAAMFAELQGDEEWNGGKLVLYNLFFFATAVAGLWCLVAGLRTPRRALPA